MKKFCRQLEENLGLSPANSVSMEISPSKKTELASERKQTLNRWSVKKVFATIAVCAITGSAANAQVKLLTNGNVGIGTTTVCNSAVRLQVNSGGNNIAITPNYGGANIGASIERLDFWHPIFQWNKVRFKGYTLSSDSTLKTEIMPLENATNILKQLKTYSYYFKSDCIDERQKDYGVLAQELEEVLPELVDMAKETKLVNYNAFFAFLIKGFNEQQTVIEAQQEEISQQRQEINILQNVAFGQEFDITQLYELRDRVEELQHSDMVLREMIFELREIIRRCCSEAGWIRQDTSFIALDSNKNKNNPLLQNEAVLYQNTPNPFSSNTEISCYIPQVLNNALIYVYNLQGVQLKSFPVTQGISTVTINASELPAGMYLYTLVVDGVIVDTKRMILTK